MTEKVTTMILKVDLQCSRCYKKIKKVLCRFPQIRDQVYDEKQNTVTITVICCSPEKIRDKLCCKGGKTIKSIEIKEPPKPKAEETPKNKPADKPKTNGKPVNPPPDQKAGLPKKAPPNPNPPTAVPEVVVKPNPPAGYPTGGCCGPCSEGIPGGPCYHGFGRPPPPPPCYLPRRPCYCYGRPCYITCCDCYIVDDPSTCIIM